MNSSQRTGRNDACFCGSGKKYKKCCLNRPDQNTTSVLANKEKQTSMDSQDPLLMTTTKEPHMPIRLYYTIHDKKELLHQLSQLKCVELNKDNRFFINYCEEAKHFGLSVKYKKVPKELYPIILAHGHIIHHTLHLDLRSFKRGTCMVEFIDKWIDRDVAEITHAATYNRIDRVTQNNVQSLSRPNYDDLFSEKNMHVIDPEALWKKLHSSDLHAQDEKQQFAMKYLKELETKPLPLIEKFPVHYYEEGIKQFDFSLKLRAMVAMEHAKGNLDCTPFQIIQKTIARSMKNQRDVISS